MPDEEKKKHNIRIETTDTRDDRGSYRYRNGDTVFVSVPIKSMNNSFDFHEQLITNIFINVFKLKTQFFNAILIYIIHFISYCTCYSFNCGTYLVGCWNNI